MKIVVYGLGIIGASIAAGLKKAGHTVFGRNRTRSVSDYAVAHGIVDGIAEDYACADAAILALPPRVAMRELDEGEFPAGCIVVDICGVKKSVEDVVLSKPRAYRYVGIHPMAGKETTGILSSDADLFRGANLVMIKNPTTDEGAFSTVRSLADDLGFGRVVVCSAEEHDRMIALTSQLAHIVSNAYIKTPLAPSCDGYTGGSFQDMTRVAPMDEAVWTELFFLNRKPLVGELRRLEENLAQYRRVLEEGDEEGMKKLIAEGKSFHRQFSSKNRR